MESLRSAALVLASFWCCVLALAQPVITAQPRSVTVIAGLPATFSVTATGTGTLTCQWQKNGSAIAGATLSTLYLPVVSTVDAGNYAVVVTNTGLSVTSTAAALTVTPTPVLDLDQWTLLKPLPQRNSLKGVVWSGNQFVAVGNNGTILTSADGTTWTSRNSGTTQTLVGVTWSGSQFVAVGNSGTILTSADGSTWTSRSSGTTQTLVGVTWSGSQLVTVGYNGTILASADGITWTSRNSGTTQSFSDVTWSGSQLVTVGNNGTILTSADGTTWTSRNSGTTDLLTGVTWTGSQLVAVSFYETIMTSADGITWTNRYSGTSDLLYGVTWTGSELVAVGYNGTILTSADGSTWTRRDYGTINSLYGVASSGGLLVAVGDSGTILTANTPPVALTITFFAPTTATAGTPVVITGTGFTGVIAVSFNGVSSTGVIVDSATQITATVPAGATTGAITITKRRGESTSSATTLTILGSRISNLSVRTNLAANQTLVVGFVTTGAKSLLIRAVGPGLVPLGISSGYYPDPKIALLNQRTSAIVAQNDNWPASLSATCASVGAFPMDPGSKDAALAYAVNGPHTAQINGTGSGIVTVEVYDAESESAARLTNVSARNQVGTGADILISGFVIDGNTSKTLLIRGIGPALRDIWGVAGALADPKLEVFRQSDGSKVTENDNWSADLLPTFDQVGAYQFKAGSKDAALLVTLPPGVYTVQVSGVGGATGDGVVEVYDVGN